MFTAFHHGIHITGETHFIECVARKVALHILYYASHVPLSNHFFPNLGALPVLHVSIIALTYPAISSISESDAPFPISTDTKRL